MPNSVYKIYDKDKNLLYIGSSMLVITRINNHASTKDWWNDVNSIQVSHFADKTTALKEESKAIKNENPLYNRQDICKKLLEERDLLGKQKLLSKLSENWTNFTNNNFAFNWVILKSLVNEGVIEKNGTKFRLIKDKS